MRSVLAELKSVWRRTDGWVLGMNVAAFAAHLANTSWRSVEVVYAAAGVPLALFFVLARRDGTLRWALGFGIATALLWAGVEGVWARLFGWWGTYDAAGPRLWDTPIYCLVVGAHACTHVAYFSLRALEVRFARPLAAGLTMLHALVLATIGENLLVAAGMWSYRSWGWMWGAVPAWVVLGYASVYAVIPWLRTRRPIAAAAIFSVLTFLTGLLASLAVGFHGANAAVTP